MQQTETFRWVAIYSAVAGLVAIALYLGPVAQPETYYGFADVREWAGIPNVGDVLSNIPFALAGLWGLWRIWRTRELLAIKPGFTATLIVFFVAVLAVSFGSGQFHLDPSDASILFDRLPIAVAAGALLAAIIQDRAVLSRRAAYGLLLAAVVFASAAVAHVTITDDLRLYAFTQLAPSVIALAFIAPWRARHHRIPGRSLLLMLAFYAAAKGAEVYDAEIYEITGLLSGHNLKHILAAGAAVMAAPIRP